MKCILTKINCFLLCSCLIFTIVITDYKKVFAMDWVVTQVTTDIALPFLMGLLGVAYVSTDGQMGAKVNEDEFLSYAETQNIPGVNVREWLENVCKGSLDQASNVWSCFKSWVKSLAYTPVYDNSFAGVISSSTNRDFTIKAANNTSLQELYQYNFDKGVYIIKRTSSYNAIFYFFDSSFDLTFPESLVHGSSHFIFSSVDSDYVLSPWTSNFTNVTTPFSLTLGFEDDSTCSVIFQNVFDYYFFGDITIPSDLADSSYIHKVEIDDTVISNDDFDAVVTDVGSLDLLNDDAITTSIPGVLPLPWDRVGETDTAISDTLTGLIEQVQEGVLSIDDYISTLQDLIGVITVDTTSDVVIPIEKDPTTGEDVTSDDIVNENINNTSFVLGGLEKVFPFCLPFDLYNFVTILKASPVAPVINFPIYNPANGKTEIITVDFGDWEPIVILFRYIFDFLFIIGLILIGRALIGGGDKA